MYSLKSASALTAILNSQDGPRLRLLFLIHHNIFLTHISYLEFEIQKQNYLDYVKYTIFYLHQII